MTVFHMCGIVCLYLRDGRRERGLAVVDMANGANVEMRLVALVHHLLGRGDG